MLIRGKYLSMTFSKFRHAKEIAALIPKVTYYYCFLSTSLE